MKKLHELGPEEFTLPPLHQAARQRDVEAVRALLTVWHDVNALDERLENGDGGNTPLWYAAQGLPGGGVPVAQLLLADGADINYPGEHGMTPLHMACSWGHADMVRYLCENGARQDLTDRWGRTPAALAQADYAEAQAAPATDRPAGWHAWLAGMAEIVAYFGSPEPAAH